MGLFTQHVNKVQMLNVITVHLKSLLFYNSSLSHNFFLLLDHIIYFVEYSLGWLLHFSGI